MSINIPTDILDFKGQCAKEIEYQEAQGKLIIYCHRDQRFAPACPLTGKAARINRYVHRTVHDIPLLNYRCDVKIELLEVFTPDNKRLIENCKFVGKGVY